MTEPYKGSTVWLYLQRTAKYETPFSRAKPSIKYNTWETIIQNYTVDWWFSIENEILWMWANHVLFAYCSKHNGSMVYFLRRKLDVIDSFLILTKPCCDSYNLFTRTYLFINDTVLTGTSMVVLYRLWVEVLCFSAESIEQYHFSMHWNVVWKRIKSISYQQLTSLLIPWYWYKRARLLLSTADAVEIEIFINYCNYIYITKYTVLHINMYL